jgi:hypothetical protein
VRSRRPRRRYPNYAATQGGITEPATVYAITAELPAD